MSGQFFFPVWTDAYLGDTRHLSTVQHGAYILILMAMWRNGGVLPNDEKRLARTVGLSVPKWRQIKSEVMELLTIDGENVFQKRLVLEYRKTLEIAAKRSSAGKSGADAKRLKLLSMPQAIEPALLEQCVQFAAPANDANGKLPAVVDPSPSPPFESRKRNDGAVGANAPGDMPWLEPEIQGAVDPVAQRPAGDRGFREGQVVLTEDEMLALDRAYPNLNVRRELMANADWLVKSWGPNWKGRLKGWLGKKDAEVEREREGLRITAMAKANAPAPARRRPMI